LARLGNPEKNLKFIHIAGTNGKGSTAAMLANILKEAGYKTGLYTSPYIHNFNERIQINGVPISNRALEQMTERIRPIADNMQDHPTEFELVTAIALEHFNETACDIVVFEVGMGGRLDSTNVIETPEVAVITAIGLDHTAELGDTVEKIAAEKAGIIKPKGTVVTFQQQESVMNVFRDKCAAQNAKLVLAEMDKLKPVRQSLDGQTFDCGNLKGLELPLLGAHQLLNASLALAAIDELKKRGWKIPETAVRDGLRTVRWPGRFEVMRKNPVFVVDGAHNPHGVESAVKSLNMLFPQQKITFLIGVLADKDYGESLKLLVPVAKRFFTVTPGIYRALPAKELAAHIQAHGAEAIVCETIGRGGRLAIDTAEAGDVICARGSLYMVGAVRECLQSV
jgi:dihydrofolate synthase/folylpolyglutamate synthase